ncbi:uncharacterized protein K02A2.6-like [Uranotaenia lowii]|uniref:uncharacterized protein K02A2.6-like n=1 Tax=Uranotaenia lowii TaxID=190385 RepID=UPI0024785CE6|nr:uncharacterized protein K02A2.6-like [Uranotaenia lowii]
MFKSNEGESSGRRMEEIFLTILEQNKQLSDQNRRMMALMESFNNQEAPNRATNNPELVLESLASNIKEFHYDPENGHTFDRWFQKYEDLFLQDGAKLEDAAKVRLLLRSLHVGVHDRYLNFLLPNHPRDFQFHETVQKLKQLFGTRVSLFSKRYQCFQLTKQVDEDFVTYAGTVNKRCEDFELNAISPDQFKSLIFICGLRSSSDSDIRTRLLSKLETDAGDCKLESLIIECQRLQNLKHDTALVEQKSSTSTFVCAVKQQRHQSKQSTQDQPNISKASNIPRTPCWQCGGIHYVRDCSYTTHTCESCGKVGHKEGYCLCYTAANPNKKKQMKKKATINSIFTISHVAESRRKFTNVTINGKVVRLQFDTASDITVISRRVWNKLGSPKLQSTDHQAKSASGKTLHISGKLQCHVTLGNITKFATCYVTSQPNLNLIGLDWMELFNLWSHPLSSICNQIQCHLSAEQFKPGDKVYAKHHSNNGGS